MSFIPDFRSLDSSAATLEAHADELRTRVRQLGTTIDVVNWSSPSASAFRRRADELRAELQQCAGQLDHAAGELRRHAATARSRTSGLATFAHLVGL